MGKIGKTARKVGAGTVIGGGLLGAALYFTSPQIPYTKYETKKELKNTLNNNQDSTFVHEDPTTTQILDFMSGTIDKTNLTQLLKLHGYSDEDIETINLPKADPALYHTIWEMHMKYANPKMKFKGDYSDYECLFKNAFLRKEDETKGGESYMAGYNYINNTINVHNLDSLPFDFNKDAYKENIYTYPFKDEVLLGILTGYSAQRVLLNNWIAELSHAYQNQQYGPIKPLMDGAYDFVTHGFDYISCYETKGTIEYDAHKIIEIDLIKEFIKLYKSYADPQDPQTARNLAKFHAGYFTNYDEIEELKKYLKISANMFENSEAAMVLGDIAFLKSKNFEWRKIPENAELFLDEALERYTIAAEYGSEEAVKKIVELSKSTEGVLKKGLQWMKHLLKNPDSPRDNMKLETKKYNAYHELLALDSTKVTKESHAKVEQDSADELLSGE